MQGLPPFAEYSRRPFLTDDLSTGILQLAEDHYIVADLNVYPKRKGNGMRAILRVFNSETGKWKIIPKLDPGNGGQFPELWSTDNVLAFDGRFLCWVDYFSGVLLADFSSALGFPALHFVPFPGEKEYPGEVRVPREYPGRFRNVSISQGKMRFVQIDNDFHETIEDEWPWRQPPERRSHVDHAP